MIQSMSEARRRVFELESQLKTLQADSDLCRKQYHDYQKQITELKEGQHRNCVHRHELEAAQKRIAELEQKADTWGAHAKASQDAARKIESENQRLREIYEREVKKNKSGEREFQIAILITALKEAELTLKNYTEDGQEAASGTLKVIREALESTQRGGEK